jgi:hypothetical protein
VAAAAAAAVGHHLGTERGSKSEGQLARRLVGFLCSLDCSVLVRRRRGVARLGRVYRHGSFELLLFELILH